MSVAISKRYHVPFQMCRSTPNSSSSQLGSLSTQRSDAIPSFGHISMMQLVPSMGAILWLHPQCTCMDSFTTGKGSSLKMCSSFATLTSTLHICSPVGKNVQWTHTYMMMQSPPIYISPKESICWLTLATPVDHNFLFCTVVSVTTLQSGPRQAKGRFICISYCSSNWLHFSDQKIKKSFSTFVTPQPTMLLSRSLESWNTITEFYNFPSNTSSMFKLGYLPASQHSTTSFTPMNPVQLMANKRTQTWMMRMMRAMSIKTKMMNLKMMVILMNYPDVFVPTLW